jgi:hypothetical protein
MEVLRKYKPTAIAAIPSGVATKMRRRKNRQVALSRASRASFSRCSLARFSSSQAFQPSGVAGVTRTHHVVPLGLWMRFDQTHALIDQQRKKDRDAHRDDKLTRHNHQSVPRQFKNIIL